MVTGEFLTFGAESVVDRVDGTPRIALLGPVLNYEETHGLVEELTSRHPDVGLIVVREQRSDLEDWVDELALHAVLSPDASDETTLELIERLSDWLVEARQGRRPRLRRSAGAVSRRNSLSSVRVLDEVDAGPIG